MDRVVNAILKREVRANLPEKAVSEQGTENFSYTGQIAKIRRIVYGMRLAVLCQRQFCYSFKTTAVLPLIICHGGTCWLFYRRVSICQVCFLRTHWALVRHWTSRSGPQEIKNEISQRKKNGQLHHCLLCRRHFLSEFKKNNNNK